MAKVPATKKGPEQSGPAVNYRKVRDGLLTGTAITIDASSTDATAVLAAYMRVFPTVVAQVTQQGDRARKAKDEGATGSRLKYAEDALWQESQVLEFLRKGDAPSSVQHALWMMLALWRVDVKNVEPEIMAGLGTQRGGRKGSKGSAETRNGPKSKKAQILLIAKEYTGSATAKVVSIRRKTGATERYIRSVLKKAEL